MRLAWHGSAALSIDTGTICLVVDPHFSRPDEYGAWYVANAHAPSWHDYLDQFRPDIVAITHAHFDHFDLHTIRRMARDTDCLFVGNPRITAVIAAEFGVPSRRLMPMAAGDRLPLHGCSLEAIKARHWLTGDEGDAVADKLAGRPDRYGAMPCGGAALGYLIDSGTEVYVSGDTEPGAVPVIHPDLAVLFIAGRMRHPRTGQIVTPALTVDDIPDLAARLRPRVVVPVHFDLDLFLEQISVDQVLAARSEPAQTVILPYNCWRDFSSAAR